MKKNLGSLAALQMANIFMDGNASKQLVRGINKVGKRKFVHTPPRSMTPEEKEYYAIHKNLKGFK